MVLENTLVSKRAWQDRSAPSETGMSFPGISQGRPGYARLHVDLVSGQSAVTSLYASSPLKLLTPRSRGPSVWAYMSSYGGGLLAGDQTRLDLKVGARARCFLSTQAATKVYRNPRRLPCSHRVEGVLARDSLVVFTPDPVQAFAGSLYRQRQQWHLDDGAGLVLLDWFCSGRAARGERWAFECFQSRNDVFVRSDPVFVDSLLLQASDDSPGFAHCQSRFDCMAMLLFIGPPLRKFAARLLQEFEARPVERRAALVCSASPIRDGALLRLAGEHVESVSRELRRQLQPLGELLGDNPRERKW